MRSFVRAFFAGVCFLNMGSVAFSQTIYFTVSQAPNGSITVFSINPGQRGSDIVYMFNTLNTGVYKSASSQIALQTLNQGLITNVQSMTLMKNGTIIVVAYLLPNNSLPQGNVGGSVSTKKFGYKVVFVEQIVDLVYSPSTIQASYTFTSSVPASQLPIFSVDLPKRAEDIIETIDYLSSVPIKTTASAVSPVSVQTSLNGPYYSTATPVPLVNATNTAPNITNPLFSNGLIPQVVHGKTTEAPNGTLLLVTFKPLTSGSYLGNNQGNAVVVVAADQVLGIYLNQ